MKKFLLALVFLLAIVFFIASFATIQQIASTLQTGKWYYVGLALGVEALWLWNVSLSYHSIYTLLGIQETRRRLFFLAAASNFINTITPTAGASAIAVFLSDAHQRNHSKARVTVAWALYLLFEYLGLLAVVMLGIVVLIRRDRLHLPETVAALILLVMACGLATLLYLGAKSTTRLGNFLASLAKLINRIWRLFTRHDYVVVERAYSFAGDVSEGITALRQKPLSLWAPMALALTNKALLLTILLLLFLAFQAPFTAGTLVGGFAIGYLFWIVSPTPSGLGVVEGVLTLSLRSLGIPLETATVVTLGFRGITFWVPLLFGLYAFRHVSKDYTGQGQTGGLIDS